MPGCGVGGRICLHVGFWNEKKALLFQPHGPRHRAGDVMATPIPPAGLREVLMATPLSSHHPRSCCLCSLLFPLPPLCPFAFVLFAKREWGDRPCSLIRATYTQAVFHSFISAGERKGNLVCMHHGSFILLGREGRGHTYFSASKISLHRTCRHPSWL